MIQIIPAIDIIDGKCVRLKQGKYDEKTIYHDDPLEVAKMFEDHGVKRLHMVDLDGAKAKHIINWKVLEKVANHTQLIIDFGGGVKTDNDISIAFQSGAEMVTVGSIAVQEPEALFSWIESYGSEKIILGADVKNEKIVTHGWLKSSDWHWQPFLSKYRDKGLHQILCTDVSKDGMMKGPSFELYKSIMDTFSDLYLIASGGVRHVEDLHRLQDMGCPAAIVGKALYEKTILLTDLEPFLSC